MDIIISEEQQKDLLERIIAIKEYLIEIPFEKKTAVMLTNLGIIARALGENQNTTD